MRLPFLLVAGVTLLLVLQAASLYGPPRLGAGGLITIGAISLWRYSWLLTNLFRSAWYQLKVFPRLRRAADRLGPDVWRPKMLHIILPTYKERPEVTQQVFQHLYREVLAAGCPTYIYFSSGGDEENRVVIEFFESFPFPPDTELVLMTQKGKRHGMAYALRAARRRDPLMEGMVVLMDGDTVFGEELFQRSLSLFALIPRLGAVTTNNLAVVSGPKWYRSWYQLRFALRSRYMQSQSLSRKVLTLTGRFSVFRGTAALTEAFITRVEKDTIHTLAEGEIEFKTGDDKSTWYQLLAEGWEMLYVPDAYIICMEHAGEHPIRESLAKMRRWSGNMLRNNTRALRLGPRHLGAFIWMAIFEQRINAWTSLVLPTTILIHLVIKNPLIIFYFTAWVIVSRCLYLSSLSIEGYRPDPRDLFLIVYQQWIGSLIKISVTSNLKQQAWSTARGDGQKEHAPFWSTLRFTAWMILWFLLVSTLVL